MPWNSVENCLFYNKAMFDAAGVAYPDETWTWAAFQRCRPSTDQPRQNQYGASIVVSANDNAFDSVIYSFGGGHRRDDTKECLIDTRAPRTPSTICAA